MNKPVNIAVIVPYPVFPAKTGGQKCITIFYDHLKDKLPVTLLCTSDTYAPVGFKDNVLPVLGVSRFRYINLFLFFKLAAIIREKKITHLIIVHPYFGWLGLLLKRFCRVKLIIHSHNIEALRFKTTGEWWWKIMRNYEKFVHSNADMNFFITDEDRQFAIKEYTVKDELTTTITYGIDSQIPPTLLQKSTAKEAIRTVHKIGENDTILFFNGTLNYLPNLNALDIILAKINPLLLRSGRPYKIIICGQGLPESYNNLAEYQQSNIIYAGFVDVISDYFLGSDIFINPVIEGGGIKTKLVEAIGFDLTSVSTRSGATGVDPQKCGGKLIVVNDGEWQQFAEAIFPITHAVVPSVFFEYFYWGKIADKAVESINKLK